MNNSLFAGWGRRIRTFAHGSRTRCPTARLSPSDVTELGVAIATLQSKSRPLPGLLKDILPLVLPQKRAEIGKLIQSQLSNPPLKYPCLDHLCHLSLAQPLLKYQPLKLISPPRQSLYMLPTTLRRPLLQAVSLALSPHAFLNGARETAWRLTAPLFLPSSVSDSEIASPIEVPITLPESTMEVALC